MNLLSYKFTEIIKGTVVTIKVNFKKYPKSKFKLDSDIFYHINSGEWLDQSKIPNHLKEYIRMNKLYEIMFVRDIYHKIRAEKIFRNIDYHDYKKLSAKLLSQYIFYMIKNGGSEAIIQNKKEFLITIPVIDGSTDVYSMFESEGSDHGKLVFVISGQFLLGRIYLSFIYSSNVNSSFIMKTIGHEFQHYLEHLRGLYGRESAVQKKISSFLRINKEKLSGSFSIIYEFLSDLYTEGIASFQERQNANKVLFDLDKIEYCRNNLLLTADKIRKSTARRFYDKAFEDSQLGPYYLGYLMCYFIALAKIKKKRPAIQAIFPKKKVIDFKKLNFYLQTNRKVYLEQLDQKTFAETYAQLSKIDNFGNFIKIYREACRELDLKEPVFFFDSNFYQNLISKCKQ